MHTNPKKVGFWRPLVDSDEPPQERDGKLYFPVRLVQDLDEHPEVADRARDLARHLDGRGRYVSEADLRRAGVATAEEYLRRQLALARERAALDVDLPVPAPGTLGEDDAERLARWLEGGVVVQSYRGYSICRVCGRLNGSRELARDGVLYPEGLVHYVRDHRAAVPGLDAAELPSLSGGR